MATINGVYHPTDGDQYKLTGTGSGSGDLGAMAASAAQKAADAAAAAAADMMAYTDSKIHFRGYLGSGPDFNTLTDPGYYYINSVSGAVNHPVNANGALEVFANSNGLLVTQRFITSRQGGPSVWIRGANLSSTGWTDWREIAWADQSYFHGNVNGPDFDTLTTPGLYFINSVSGATNHPIEDTGALEVFANSNGLLLTQRFTSSLPGGPSVWVRGANLSRDGWAAWREVGAGSATTTTADPLRRAMLQEAFTARRGGTIGTNGLPVVALRFDHHLTHFESKVLPLLRQHALPWAQIMNADTWDGANNSGMTPAELQAAALSSGGEVWNHGGDHQDATGESAIHDQIVGSLERLAADLPDLPIEGWAPPGLAVGGYDGYAPGNTISQHTATYAGQLILSHHAAVAGYIPGWYRTLDGGNRVGLAHNTIDSASPSTVANTIDGVVNHGAGVALMLHSNYLDESGYLTTAELGTILADIAARRDAGEIVVLTYSGLCLADARSDHRHNLLPEVAATAGTYSQTVALSRQPQYAGGTRELVAQVASTAGATMTVTINGSATTHTIPAGGGIVRRFATLPLGQTSVDVTIARTAGTQHSISDVQLLAA